MVFCVPVSAHRQRDRHVHKLIALSCVARFSVFLYLPTDSVTATFTCLGLAVKLVRVCNKDSKVGKLPEWLVVGLRILQSVKLTGFISTYVAHHV